jgi:hypothetical protein
VASRRRGEPKTWRAGDVSLRVSVAGVRSRKRLSTNHHPPTTIHVDILSSALFSLFLLACAAGLMVLHVRAWRVAQRSPLGDREREYRSTQYRRRMQTSAMLGLLAVAIFAGSFITEPPLAVLLFWAAVLVVLGWVALLAVADMVATKLHFGRLQQHNLVEQAKLQAEVRRVRGNGRAKDEGGRTRDEGGGRKAEG